jgi:hypothetical protein
MTTSLAAYVFILGSSTRSCPWIAVWVALLCALAGAPAAAQSVTALDAAQIKATAGLRSPQYSPVRQPIPSVERADTDSTTRHYDPGNWKRGALIGGVAGGVLGGIFAVGVLCHLTDESCVAQTISTIFVSGAIGAFVGAVLIPAEPTPR